MQTNYWHEDVPNDVQFRREIRADVSRLAKDHETRSEALSLLLRTREYQFSYKNQWLGVPIIRMAEDLAFQQELIFSERPDLVVEIGVARGGGLIFSASMQLLSNLTPNVVGVDNKVFPHTKAALEHSSFQGGIRLIEGDSNEPSTIELVRNYLGNATKALLILDSDHSAAHVYSELVNYVPLLPANSLVMVCDTIIDEFPPGTFEDRSWSDGKGPLEGLTRYRKTNKSLEPAYVDEVRSLLLSEIRDGVFRKTK